MEQRLEVEAVPSRNALQTMHNNTQEETMNRTKHNEKMDMRTEGTERRLEDLELHKNDAANQSQSESRQPSSASAGWSPSHIILRGWPDKAPRDEIEETARLMIGQVPHDIKSKLQAPYVPKVARQHREGVGQAGSTRDGRLRVAEVDGGIARILGVIDLVVLVGLEVRLVLVVPCLVLPKFGLPCLARLALPRPANAGPSVPCPALPVLGLPRPAQPLPCIRV